MGGKARARNLTPEQRSEIARKGAQGNTPEQQKAKRLAQIAAAKKAAKKKGKS